MKIKELREKIRDAGGELRTGGIVLSYNGGDIDVSTDRGMFAWIGSTKNEDNIASDEFSTSGGLACVDSLIELAQFLGVTVSGVKPVEIVKEVVVPDVKVSADLSRVTSDWQRSENERGAEKRAYQWVVSELADKLRG